jgi:hypothetical protein
LTAGLSTFSHDRYRRFAPMCGVVSREVISEAAHKHFEYLNKNNKKRMKIGQYL